MHPLPKTLLALALSTFAWGFEQDADRIQTWTGKFVDANCRTERAEGGCSVNEQTQRFGIQSPDGKLMRLNEKGNEIAQLALKTTKKQGDVRATVKGVLQGDTIRVETVSVE